MRDMYHFWNKQIGKTVKADQMKMLTGLLKISEDDLSVFNAGLQWNISESSLEIFQKLIQKILSNYQDGDINKPHYQSILSEVLDEMALQYLKQLKIFQEYFEADYQINKATWSNSELNIPAQLVRKYLVGLRIAIIRDSKLALMDGAEFNRDYSLFPEFSNHKMIFPKLNAVVNIFIELHKFLKDSGNRERTPKT